MWLIVLTSTGEFTNVSCWSYAPYNKYSLRNLRKFQDKKTIFYFLMTLIIVSTTIMENMVYDSIVCDGNSLNPLILVGGVKRYKLWK